MKSEAVKLARIKANQDVIEHLMTLAKNPLVIGFGALMANHAIYKSGWYKPSEMAQTGQKAEKAAMNVHDSIAFALMLATIMYAANYGKINVGQDSSLKENLALLKAGTL